jgi:RimJ/RimL family protein N-acetyltransferase
MTALEIPEVATARLGLRAFRACDLDAYAAMQADPAVMRYAITDPPRPAFRSGRLGA